MVSAYVQRSLSISMAQPTTSISPHLLEIRADSSYTGARLARGTAST